MHQELPATLESIAAARGAMRRFTSDLEVDADAIVLAVSEAVANAVAHAYAEGARGVVDISAVASPFEVTVWVRDRGRGLAAGAASSGAGLGLGIIERLAQHVELADAPDGVALKMAFRRGGARSAS
jgi:serine/threonine-protein kinase RsbW